MTVYAGTVTSEQTHPHPGTAKSMLTFVVAPHHSESNHAKDPWIDLACQHRGDDPGFYVDDDLCVVVCGRLDDRKKLLELLSISEDRDNTGRLLAAAYHRWGEGLTDHIFGEFAFAIWNRENHCLFCGRDRFGQMPFAYMTTEFGIVFATDFISVAMSTPDIPAPNEAWIIEYVSGAVCDEENTPFQGVKRLPPACTLTWRDGELSIQKYWSFEEIAPTAEEVDLSRLSKELEHAIANRANGSQSATMLSGGLDSSSIAVLSRDLYRETSNRQLPSVSLVFDDFPGESERPFIDSVLEQGGFDPHFVNVKEYDAVSVIERFIRIQGAPTHGIGTPIFDQAIEKAEELGFSSVLDGHGGDEIISSDGIMRFSELARSGAWLTLIREMRRFSRGTGPSLIRSFVGLYGAKGRGLMARIFRKIQSRFKATTGALKESSLLRSDWESHPSAALAKHVARASLPPSHNTERSFQESILSSPLQSHAFEVLHRLFRSRGIRPEFPYWDYRVVDCCLRAPSRQKLKHGVPRSLIRSVMADRLPKLVVSRSSKFDFNDAHLRSLQSCIEHIERYSTEEGHKAFDYVDRSVFASSISDLNHEDRTVRVQAAKKVWFTLNLILWFDLIGTYQSRQKGHLETSC